MRWPFIFIALTAACSPDSTPPTLPFSPTTTVVGVDAYEKRQGQVEIIVKSNYEGIKDDIRAGGGANLTKAMDAAGVPERDRPTRISQLQSDFGLHRLSASALVTALMVYGS